MMKIISQFTQVIQVRLSRISEDSILKESVVIFSNTWLDTTIGFFCINGIRKTCCSLVNNLTLICDIDCFTLIVLRATSSVQCIIRFIWHYDLFLSLYIDLFISLYIDLFLSLCIDVFYFTNEFLDSISMALSLDGTNEKCIDISTPLDLEKIKLVGSCVSSK